MKIEKKTLKTITAVIFAVLLIFGLQYLLTRGKSDKEASGGDSSSFQQLGNVDKIQVVHFHATQQCWSCITVGKYTEKAIKEKFPDEFASGKIEFVDVNSELPENSAIVKKFGASGSSLFINVIREGKDNISEDVQVWRLISNEKSFIDYFEGRLKGYLE